MGKIATQQKPFRLSAWEVAALERSLAHAIERGDVEAVTGKHLLQKLLDAAAISVTLLDHSMEEPSRGSTLPA